MNIETKFNTGTEVWIMKDNKPTQTIISRIYINVINGYDPIVKYDLRDKDDGLVYDSEIITTKENLLKTL